MKSEKLLVNILVPALTLLVLLGVRKIRLTGGEPLVRRDFLEIVDALLERGIMIPTIYSNGRLVTDELLDTLAACTGIVSPGWVAEMAVAIETVRIGGYTLVTILGALGGVIECLGLVFILLLYLEDAAGSRIPRIAGALSKLKRWDFNEEQV